jgi:thiol:disulfide interchange protein
LHAIAWLLLLLFERRIWRAKARQKRLATVFDSVFAQTKKEGRFVSLNLGAVWCHWCHVMDEITYQDPQAADCSHKGLAALATLFTQTRHGGMESRSHRLLPQLSALAGYWMPLR